jgi:broad specificity phosphatase PhoE
MLKTIYMIRHGHYIMDRPYNPEDIDKIKVLSLNGLETIINLGKRLRAADHQITKILYSPLRRTYETAIIIKKILHVDMQASEKIVESFFEGGNIPHLKEVYNRFTSAVDNLLDHEETAVIVSHELPIGLYLKVQSGMSYEEISKDKSVLKILKMGDCVKCRLNKEGTSYRLINYEHI